MTTEATNKNAAVCIIGQIDFNEMLYKSLAKGVLLFATLGEDGDTKYGSRDAASLKDYVAVSFKDIPNMQNGGVFIIWGKYSGSVKVKFSDKIIDLPLVSCEYWRMADPEHKRVQNW